MDYSDTLDYLFTRLPMFQRVGPAAYKDNLDNTYLLSSYYNNPHRLFRSIHVAGTNGKGSVSHMLAAVLQSAGYKTGLYTSPHLLDFRERIRINGEMIATDDVVAWIEDFREKNESWDMEPSFFELTVAMAFDYFARQQVDIAVIEVGLGGRLDSTNILSPDVSVITNIGFDHTAILGDTLEKIAFEKAGIIKPGIPVVIGTTQPETVKVFNEVAALELAPLFFADQEFKVDYLSSDIEGNQLLSVKKFEEVLFPQLMLDLKGRYQQKNLPPVLKAVELLRQIGWKVSDDQLLNGLANAKRMTGLQGRWQILGYNPLTVADTAHNSEGITEVVNQLKETPYKRLHFIIGVVNDKDLDKILSLLPDSANYYFTRADIPRALDERELARVAERYNLKGAVYPSVEKAYNAARNYADESDLIFIGGSTFVVAEIL